MILRMKQKLFWNKPPVFAATDLYSCIPFAELIKNGNDVKRGEAAEANGEAFRSLLEERRGFKLVAEYSVIVTESKNGAG